MSKKNPWHVKKARGTKITPEQRAVLAECYDRCHKEHGINVLGSLSCRVPGFCTFFATAFDGRWDSKHGPDNLPPFGVVKVCFLNNGNVTCRVMGTEKDSYIVVGTESLKAN